MLVWLSVWSEVQIVCIWSSWCHCHPKTPSSLASFKSRLVLPYWYKLIQVVLENRLLNRCSSSVVCNKQQQQRPFNGLWSGTTRVGRYQKEHSPTHTHPNQRASFITFLHLQRSMASSLFNLLSVVCKWDANDLTTSAVQCCCPTRVVSMMMIRWLLYASSHSR